MHVGERRADRYVREKDKYGGFEVATGISRRDRLLHSQGREFPELFVFVSRGNGNPDRRDCVGEAKVIVPCRKLCVSSLQTGEGQNVLSMHPDGNA